MKTRFILYLVCIVSLNLNAQKIVTRAFVKDKNIILRFVARNIEVWNDIKTEGFKIERAEIDKLSDTSTISNSNFKLLTQTALKPLEKDNSKWKEIINTTDYGAFAYQVLHGKQVAKTDQEKQATKVVWGMLMKQADLNIECAKLVGLYYRDTEINLQKIYVYKIYVLDKTGNIKHTSKQIVNPKEETYLAPLKLKVSETKGRKVSLTFEAKKNEHYYTGYVLERSTDSLKDFASVTPKPIIFLTGEHEKNKTDITHQDTLPNTKAIYFYRIKGISYFGEFGPTSKTVRVKGQESLGAFPFMDSVKLVKKETQIKIYFHFPKEANLSVIKGINIVRSEKTGERGITLNPKPLPYTINSFIDEKPMQTNYYKVLALTIDGDTIPSFDVFGMLPDRDPPKIPSGINGYIDSLGLVHIKWDANSEKDIQGYRIFRKNDLNEELIERTRRIVTTESYIDTVDIKTLTKYVYYSLTAVDKVFNNSKYSPVIKLKRPDIIAPVPPVFVQTNHDKKGVILKWYKSTSDDVEKYELYRINFNTKLKEKLREWLVKDTTSHFVDSTATLGETYNYEILVYDDSKNKAKAVSTFITFETGLRKPITDIKSTTDLENRKINLVWSYNEKEIYNYIIYKAKEGEEFRIYKTVKPAQLKITDTNVYPGNIYKYRIKATYISGVESELSKEIKVIF